MKNINNEINCLEKQLKDLKTQQKESVQSVKEHRDKWHHNGIKDTCEQVICLVKGEIYEPYSLEYKHYSIRQAKEWKKDNLYDFCYIYQSDGYGSPIGVISTKEYLIQAVGTDGLKAIWRNRVESSNECRGFTEFVDYISKNIDFLLECVNEIYEGYEVYENSVLQIQAFYLIIFDKKQYL